jgi:antitoxin (DNA-binding transcriptional repressor) of toxin-antitoxin stability system
MTIKRSGVEQARKNLPALLERANRGQPSLVTKHGQVYAAIVPPHYVRQGRKRGPNILALRGTGKGLWGASVKRAIRQLRAEWD